MSKCDGGSAFPVPVDVNPDGVTCGMTLRDYFAAKAIQALVSNSHVLNTDAASHAYKIADAMLAERSKP